MNKFTHIHIHIHIHMHACIHAYTIDLDWPHFWHSGHSSCHLSIRPESWRWRAPNRSGSGIGWVVGFIMGPWVTWWYRWSKMVKPMITMLNHWFDWFNHWFNWFNHWLNYVNNIFSCIESTMMAQLGQGDPMAMKREREREREGGRE